ncbi:hypothetical protein ASPZODRAFT_137412 [Penicilliopsis zonata CBS 506.65]|uniref:Uncharacterized protein n=1 Tax=Penicilliopsis zonata CBS 506.65 TaxID=1073090 RepID=A0A1L9S4Y7_9EURO|nr:hypothetical protein ASPZODRAFT_137412 [Penicilliopsis zonata CBS 506.65]OJJ42220.1 hypothetical protein ASPZODRAFT_137412 [Penicilliopsis zonata CBS 506.65]
MDNSQHGSEPEALPVYSISPHDGHINIDLESRIAQTLARIIELETEDEHHPPPEYTPPTPTVTGCPVKLNIVIQIVGSRGDVQPFLALGQALQQHGHRVRIATHEVFADFVRGAAGGVEFFPIGGNPAELMAFMVKNPGLIPQLKTVRGGEIARKKAMVADMLEGCWRSCLDPDPVTGRPFVADAIIANPPSFAHVHCAQALAIPVHLMFTMPWTSTRDFAHPLANLRSASSMNPRTANWVSYGLVEWLTWQGLGGVINRWRVSIDLDPIPTIKGPSLAEALKIPFTYCWSPALVPKPADWPAYIDVCGFFFRDPPRFNPPEDLEKFLQAGPPPVYIGFGSIVVEDPQALIQTVLDAVTQCGVRAIVSKGWSNIMGDQQDHVFYLGDCPHEWLFQHVSAVVHHGGAGTTACGLFNGRATTIVPFFGDQPFWGKMVAQAGAGPEPIPYACLTAEKLAAAIQFCLTPEATAAAQAIAATMRAESGVAAAVSSFHRNLPLDRMRCSLMPNQPAAWRYTRRKDLLLSKAAVSILLKHGCINERYLVLHRVKPVVIENRRWDPLTGMAASLTSTGSSMLQSTTDMLVNPYHAYRRQLPSLSAERSFSSVALTAGSMAGASLQGFGKFTASYFKGVIVDFPHAAAEGFRQVPRMYGETPTDYGPIEDWKSGMVMGGRNFFDGLTDGVGGFFVQPVQGAKKEGALGAIKGVAKGTLGLITKVPSAGIGLVAYPFEGIAKSIEGAFKSKTPKAIVRARLHDGYAQLQAMGLSEEEEDRVLQAFDTIL